MSNRQVFVDECGYTGPDLVNSEQPVFVLASLGCDEATCQELKARFFGNTQAQELKHSRLSRSARGRSSVVSFIQHVDAHQDLMGFTWAHKTFGLCAKLIDWIVEPVVHQMGENLYRDGGNLALANLTFHSVREFEGNEGLVRLLAGFQNLCREPNEANLHAFAQEVFDLNEPEALHNVMEPIRLCLFQMGLGTLQQTRSENLDLALSCALALVGFWRARLQGEFEVVHDESSNMARQGYVWDAIVDPELPAQLIGYDRRTQQFPIGVTSTKFAPSKDWAGLQLADVLAGSIARATVHRATGREPDGYEKSLFEIVGQWTPAATLWPEQKFTPEELGTVGKDAADPLAYFADAIRRHSNTDGPAEA